MDGLRRSRLPRVTVPNWPTRASHRDTRCGVGLGRYQPSSTARVVNEKVIHHQQQQQHLWNALFRPRERFSPTLVRLRRQRDFSTCSSTNDSARVIFPKKLPCFHFSHRTGWNPSSESSLRSLFTTDAFTATRPAANGPTPGSLSSHSSVRVSFLTDVEGDAAYLDRYVRLSRVLTFRPVTSLELDELQRQSSCASFPFPYPYCLDFIQDVRRRDTASRSSDNWSETCDMLVFGGDLWDQGDADLYVIRQLLHFQQRYPDRVHLIMGNRDINKMRFASELGLSTTSDNTGNEPLSSSTSMLPPHGGVYWWRGRGGVADPEFRANRQGHEFTETAVERLQWILRFTMGSPRAFQNRHLELVREEQYKRTVRLRTRRCNIDEHIKPVSDDDVVSSYRQSCHPLTGEMGQYLSRAKLVVRIGNALFLHGALPLTTSVIEQSLVQVQASAQGGQPKNKSSIWDDLTFAMPWLETGQSASDVGVKSITDWFTALNLFASEMVQDWRSSVVVDSVTAKHQATWATVGGYHSHPSFVNDSTAEAITCFPKYTNLLQYGMGWLPDGTRNATAVYSSWSTDGLSRRSLQQAAAAATHKDRQPPQPMDSVETNIGTNQNSPPTTCTHEEARYNHHQQVHEQYVALVREFFERTDINVICTGHQPQGDCPNPIRLELPSQNRTAWIVCADTSYSGDTLWHHDDDRDFESMENTVHANIHSGTLASCNGKNSDVRRKRCNFGRGENRSGRGNVAVSEVLLSIQTSTGTVHSVVSHGTLSDGTNYETKELLMKPTPELDTSLIVGRIAPPLASLHHNVPSPSDTPHGNPWWVRAEFQDDAYLLVTSYQFQVWNRIVSGAVTVKSKQTIH